MYRGTFVVVQGPRGDATLAGVLDDLKVTLHNSRPSALGQVRRMYRIDDREVDNDHLEAHLDGEPVRIVEMPDNTAALNDLYVVAGPAERLMLANLEIRAGHKWRCPKCSYDNARDRSSCERCGTERPAPGRAREGAVVVVSE